MKEERIVAVRDFLMTQMNHWVLFSAGMTLWGLLHWPYPGTALLIALSLVPFFMFLCRRYTNQLWLFVTIHLLIALSVWLLAGGNLPVQIVTGIFLAGYFLRSVFLRIRTEHRMDSRIPPVVAVCFLAGMLFLQRFQGRQDWDGYYIAAALMYLVCYFLEHYLNHFSRFLLVNESSAGYLPAREMFASGLGLVSLFAIGAAVLMWLGSLTGWLDSVLSVMKRLWLWLIGLLPKAERGAEPVVEEKLPEQEMQSMLDMLGEEAAEPSVIWMILEKIFFTAVSLGLIALLLWGLWKLFRFLTSRFQVRLSVGEESLGSVKDVRERCEIEKRKKGEGRQLWDFLKPSERIRRMYKRKAWASRKELSDTDGGRQLSYMTAREWGERLLEKELAGAYEKARYSNEECTPEDVKRASRGGGRR